MSRLQYCRKHIDDVAEACDLSRRTIEEVKQGAKFCDENGEFSRLPTSAILTLIRVKDTEIRDRAISLAQKALSLTTPTGGKKTKSFAAKDIKKIIDIATTEIRMERKPEDSPTKPEEKKQKPTAEPTKILSPQPSLAAQMKAKDDGFFIPTTPDPAKAKSARMEELAVELLSMYSPTFQTMVNEIVRVRNTPTSHYGVKDAFYFGVQALAEKKP